MTDAPETEAAPVPAPVRARALAGLIDLVPCDALILVLGKTAGQTGFLIGLVAVVAVFSLLEARGGQTPGKRLVGLEVRYLDGTPCDTRSAVIRHPFRFLDLFPGRDGIGGLRLIGKRPRPAP